MPSTLNRRLQSFAASRAVRGDAQVNPPVSPSCDLGGCVREGPKGPFYLIERHVSESLAWKPSPLYWLIDELELVHGIGPRVAERLRSEGLISLRHLVGHPRFGREAALILRAIERKDTLALLNRGASDADLLSFYEPTDIVFLDIETTSLYNSQPLFLAGLLCTDRDGLSLRQFFARSYEEEAALIEAVIAELQPFRVLVTYNGRSFDLPYLNGRAAAHRIDSRLCRVHLDLLHHARRRYRSDLPDCKLVTVQENILGQMRGEDVPGEMVPRLYHDFVRTQNPEVIRVVIEHNAMDLLALAHMLPLLA